MICCLNHNSFPTPQLNENSGHRNVEVKERREGKEESRRECVFMWGGGEEWVVGMCSGGVGEGSYFLAILTKSNPSIVL